MRLEPGTKINQYVLERRLGDGASGEVWVAHDETKTAALKFMREQHLVGAVAEKHRQRLLNEVAIVSRLRYPHVPALYDYDLDFERPYLAMQYIDGDSYEKLIATGAMQQIHPEKRLTALRIIAETIAAIHASGIIHRDIKPASINGIETPYLLDYGIALDRRDVAEARPDVGTGIYMPPPETPIGELSDYYSFAVVAYEVLLGCHPIFTAENIGKTVLETRQRAGEIIQNRRWRRPTQISIDELPGDLRGADLSRLEEIFQQAFELRYTNSTQLVDDLQGALLTSANQPYLDNPTPVSSLPSIPAAEHYTDEEVDRARRITESGVTFRMDYLLWLGVGILVVVGIVIVLLLGIDLG